MPRLPVVSLADTTLLMPLAPSHACERILIIRASLSTNSRYAIGLKKRTRTKVESQKPKDLAEPSMTTRVEDESTSVETFFYGETEITGKTQAKLTKFNGKRT